MQDNAFWIVIFMVGLLLAGEGCSAPLASSQPTPAEALLKGACDYLWAKQGEDGGWHSEVHGLLRSGQALTPFVLHALLEANSRGAAKRNAAIDRAVTFIRNSVNNDGVVGLSDPELLEYPNYATAFALRCLLASPQKKDAETIVRICNYLKSQQLLESRGIPADHPAHGAWGFGGPLPLGGSPGHVDISYTRHVLEALAVANAIDDEIATSAQQFLDRMQIKGGFSFSPVVDAANKGERIPAVDGGTDIHLPYATATSEGLLALLATGAGVEDARVISAQRWLEEHPDLEHPGGIPRDHPEQWGKVLFYYHLAIRGEVARALDSGESIAEPLSSLLTERQRDDGSFVNPDGTLMKEDCPILATALAVIALTGSIDR